MASPGNANGSPNAAVSARLHASTPAERIAPLPRSHLQSPSHSQSQSQSPSLLSSLLSQQSPSRQTYSPLSSQPSTSSAGFRSYAPATSAPNNSQDSLRSESSATTSNGHASSQADTAITSPLSSSPQTQWYSQHQQQQQQQQQERNDSAQHGQSGPAASPSKAGSMAAPTERGRVRTPEEQTLANGGEGVHGMPSPTRHKRTASGLMKPGSEAGATSSLWPSPGKERRDAREIREMRAESESSNGSRAGEAAAQLKTRLAYAMAKVQHGWQNHNIDQVEVLAQTLTPRTTPSTPTAAAAQLSSAPRGLISPRTALTSSAQRLSMHDARPITYHDHSPTQTVTSPPSKRRSGAGIVSWAGSGSVIPPFLAEQQQQHSPRGHRRTGSNKAFPASFSAGPSLAPAADIRPATSSSSSASAFVSSPSHQLQSRHDHARAETTTTPRTPSKQKRHPPPAPLQPPSQLRSKSSTAQAEQDAMDALMLMGGSPSGTGSGKFPAVPFSSSQNASQRSSPLRNERVGLVRGSSHVSSSSSSEDREGGNVVDRAAKSRTSELGPGDGAEEAAGASSLSSSQQSISQFGGSQQSRITREGRERVLDEAEEGAS